MKHLLYTDRLALAKLIDNWHENHPSAERDTVNTLAILDHCDLLDREGCRSIIETVGTVQEFDLTTGSE